ncbi:type II toxin-antitoxin system HipA family toxin [Herbiconiux sp. P16]|uniref:type II toxin-antitoxin system HipA family toxin n=1 Tax=Herbiconiux wuyangfengii TaxID=3342794 RepID=UPI0035BA45B3
MPLDLDRLRFEDAADVYKAGVLAGGLDRTEGGGVAFTYSAAYADDPARPAVASTLPVSRDATVSPGGSVPAFFAGLLPEGRRLSVLRQAVKTSLDDELTLLLAVGADVPGDVQVVPRGTVPRDPDPIVDVTDPAALDFRDLVDAVDLHGIPGVQEKLSSEMISSPVADPQGRYILKLEPADYPHLVENEATHLVAATRLKLPVSRADVIEDAIGAKGLLVTRFDRVPEGGGSWAKLPLEDATQVLGLPPADKYRVASEDVVSALASLTVAPAVSVRNLYLQFVFAWLTGNRDLHGKNVAVLGDGAGHIKIAPLYDLPCTLIYGDDSLALPIGGRTRNLKARHWAEFAESIGLPRRAAQSANAIALQAAASVDLSALPFAGSPLRRAQRELGFRRSELS